MKLIEIYDQTLRAADGAHALSFRQKAELLTLLAKTGVDIAALAPVSNESVDTLLVKTVADSVTHTTLSLPVTTAGEAETAARVLASAPHAMLSVVLPVSTVQMEYKCHLKPAAMLDRIRTVVAACCALSLRCAFFAQDATRAEEHFLTDAVKAAVEAGADTVILSDDAGMLLPDSAAALISRISASVPDGQKTHLGIACSDAFSMGCANSLTAAAAGASLLVCAVGTVSLPGSDALGAALHAHAAAQGLSCKLTKTELSRLTAAVSEQLNGNASAIPAGNPVADESFLLGASSSQAEVEAAAHALGYELSPEDGAKLYDAFLRIAEKKSVSARELDALIASETMQVRPTYLLKQYLTTAGNTTPASAQIVLQKGAQTLDSISIGDGPIDAAFQTLEQIVGCHYELDEFQIQAVTEGREAMGSALVRLRADGRLYSGIGTSTDIIGASIRAWLNALNKIVAQENT